MKSEEEIEIIDFEPQVNTKTEGQKETITKEDIKSSKQESKNKKTNNVRGIVIVFLIFIVLGVLIYFLPDITKYITKEESNTSTITKKKEKVKYSSNIDLNKVLTEIKKDNNYIYEQNIEINTIDKNEIPQKITTNLIYRFNPTKFQIDISKTVGNYNEVSYEYYEKLDQKYNKYLYDITTKKLNLINTDEIEYNSIFNIYNNVITNLIENNEIVKEELILLDNEEQILISTKNNKNIYNLLSFKTDRINSEFDITNIGNDEVYVNYIFNKDKELIKIELELETIDGYKEEKVNKVTSINITFTFKDFNTVKDILIPYE